jgi:hypothetical protein
MSKGRRRKAWVAMANRKRNPEAWFDVPVASPKPKRKARAVTYNRPAGERGGRDGV